MANKSARLAAVRDAAIIEGWVQGRTDLDMAKEFKMHRGSIRRVIVRHRRKLVDRIRSNVETKTGMLVQYWIGIYKKAEASFELSLLKKETTKKRSGSRDGKPFAEVGVDTEDQRTGDPAFLVVMGKALDAIERLLGLTKPTKLAFTDGEGRAMPIQIIRFVEMPGRQETIVDALPEEAAGE